MRAQITVETTLIFFGIIMVTVIAIFVMMKVAHVNPTSTSIPVHLISLSVNKTVAIAFMSSVIKNPKSLYIVYQNVSSSNTLTFSFSNCYLIENKSNNVMGEYIFNSTNSCNFSQFQGTYKILYAYYLNNGVETSIEVNNRIFGFIPTTQPYYAKMIVSPQVVTYNSMAYVKVETNLANANYSLKVNNYPVISCQNINVLNPCEFTADPSFGIYNSIQSYNISATVYNSSLSDSISNFFIVIPN